jgi:hypothetical protein
MSARLGGQKAVSCNLAIACGSATFVILARLQTVVKSCAVVRNARVCVQPKWAMVDDVGVRSRDPGASACHHTQARHSQQILNSERAPAR